MSKKILFLHQSAPYANQKAQANFNLLTTASAFDFTVSIAFIADGVLQLVKKQQSDLILRKNLAKQIAGLELFPIAHIYAEKDAIMKRNLKMNDLIVSPKLITPIELNKIMQDQNFIISL